MIVGAYSREFLSVFVVFCLRINAPLRLREPTEAMRLPQMNTCYPRSAQTLLEREEEREREVDRSGGALFYALSTVDGVFALS